MIDEILSKLDVPGKLIYLSQYGSHLYGLNTEKSDLDFRGVFIPHKKDIILKRDADEYNTAVEIFEIITPDGKVSYSGKEPDVILNSWKLRSIKVDVKLFSIYKFLKLCAKGDTNALDLLFSVDPRNKEDYVTGRIVQYYQEYFFDDATYCLCGCERWDYYIQYIWENANKLINTNNLSSPITYAHKQAEKYSIKGERLNKLKEILKLAQEFLDYQAGVAVDIRDFYYDVLVPKNIIDNKHVKLDELDNKGKMEQYLYVGGVQHQFNLQIEVFIERLHEKIEKEYTSERTKNAADGNDWKALSHALRILLQVKELLDRGSYYFPNKDAAFLKDVKLGKVAREDIDKYFNENLEDILNQVQEDKLGWRYDEEFWNDFLLRII